MVPGGPGGIKMAAPATLNHRHEQIINWLIANPHRPLRDCALAFNYTQSWLSQIVHSDMFQEAYRRRADELGVEVVHTLKDRLTAYAALALERNIEQLEKPGCSENFLGSAMANTLKALGYSTQQQEHKHLHVHVDPQTLVEARERAALAARGQSPQKLGPVLVEASKTEFDDVMSFADA